MICRAVSSWGSKTQHKKPKELLCGGSVIDHAQEAHLPHHSVVAHPSPLLIRFVSPYRRFVLEGAEARRVPWCVPCPGEACCQVPQVFHPRAKETHSSVGLLANLTKSWEGRRENMYLDKDRVTVLSLLVLGRTRHSFQAVLNWLRKLITSQDWTQTLCLCMTISWWHLDYIVHGQRTRQQGFLLLQITTRHTNVISCEGKLEKVPKKP